MHMKLHHLLLLGLAGVSAVNVPAKWTGTEIAGSIEKWTNVGIEAGHVGTNPGLKAAMVLIGALGLAIPGAAPFAVLVSGIMSFYVESDTDIITGKLENMNKQLKRIDAKLDQVLHLIVQQVRDTTIKSHYQMQIDRMKAIKVIYDRFIGNPTNETRKDFRHSCREVKMLTFAHWIAEGLAGNSLLPLRRLIVANYDISNLNVWSYRIAQALSKATFLHITCVGVSEEGEQTIRDTLNGARGRGKGDIALFQEVFRKVTQSFNEARKEIKRNHFLAAKGEAEAYLHSHEGDSNKEFHRALYAHLSQSYPERAWLVAAWNYPEPRRLSHYWNFNERAFHAYWANQRSAWSWSTKSRILLVGSLIRHGKSALEWEVKQCLHHFRQRNAISSDTGVASEVSQKMEGCLRTRLGALAVTMRGLKGHAHYATGSGFATRYSSGEDTSAPVWILAFPSDPTFNTSIDICQMREDSTYIYAPPGNHCCQEDATSIGADDEIRPGCDYSSVTVPSHQPSAFQV